jgi:TonB family protein
MNAIEWGRMIVQTLGWCLIHFLWQATLVGALYAVARWLLPRGNPRYLAGMLALFLLALLPAWSFLHEWRALARVMLPGDLFVAGTGSAILTGVAGAPAAHADGMTMLRIALPWLVLAWACGVAVLALRVARQWRQLRAIVRAAEALPVWQARAGHLGQRLGLRHAVRVLASVRIATPTLVGWVRPAVVMPLAMLARMPAEQVDWILAHELAHLRRLDHLANLFQVVLETLFFYHPVVHWISRDARRERELCCDALALQAAAGKRRDFVAALAGLEEFRAGHSYLALAASGGLLAERAWFVAGRVPPRKHAPAHGVVLLAGLLGAALLTGFVGWHAAMQRRAAPAAAPAAATEHAVQSAPAIQGKLSWHVKAVAQAAPAAQPVQQAIVVTPPPLPQVAVQPLRISVPLTIGVHDLQAAASALRVLPAAATEPPQAVVPTSAAVAIGTLPVPVRVVAPDYPERALQNGTRGSAVVAFTLDADGHPRALEVVSATPAGVFDSAALAAIRQWRFAPPEKAGRRFRQVFSFAPAGQGTYGAGAGSDGCRYVTGSHICREYSDASATVQMRPGTSHGGITRAGQRR